MSADLKSILTTIEDYLPLIGQLVAALDPKDAKTIGLAQSLAVIVTDLLQMEQKIRGGLDDAMMEQIAQANRDADGKLIGN